MMRICPKCSAYYADDSSAFCLVDGTPLVNVDPSSDKWSEGTRVIEAKENALRKQKRKLKWRRVVLSTMLIATMVVCVVAINRWVYVETVRPRPTPTPTPSPSTSPTPTPTLTTTRVYKVSGRVTSNGRPLSGVNMMLKGTSIASRTTDANGYYSFIDLRAEGSYTITPAMANMNFTPPSLPISRLTKDVSADFIGLEQVELHKISGRVTDASGPLVGVTIRLGGTKIASTTTDAQGNYAFVELRAGGSYTITPVSGKMKFTPPSQPINNLRKDESAHFSRDTPPPPECSAADKDREERTIEDRFSAQWQRKIERDPPKMSANGLAVGQKPTLGLIEYRFTFVKECTGAFITATYVWEVTSPVGRTRVPGEKKFGCVKVVGMWVCP